MTFLNAEVAIPPRDAASIFRCVRDFVHLSMKTLLASQPCSLTSQVVMTAEVQQLQG